MTVTPLEERLPEGAKLRPIEGLVTDTYLCTTGSSSSLLPTEGCFSAALAVSEAGESFKSRETSWKCTF